MKRLGYFLVTLLFFATASAQTYCPGFDLFLGVEIDNSWGTSHLRCDDLNSIKTTYQKVRDFSPYGLMMPILKVQNSPMKGNEVGRFNMITSTYEMGVDAKQTSHKMDLVKHFAHEIGHHIFYSYVYRNLPEYRKVGQILELYYQSMVVLRQKRDSDTFLQEKEFVNFHEMINSVGVIPKEMADFDRISESYQELFSDVVAALAFDDPQAMKKASFSFGMSREDSDLRSFMVKSEISEKTATTSHYYFAPLRKAMWDDWIRPKEKEKEAILKELLSITVSEVNRRLAENEKAPENLQERLDQNRKNILALMEKLFPQGHADMARFRQEGALSSSPEQIKP